MRSVSGIPPTAVSERGEEHPVAERCENLGRRWAQRDRPPHDRPRVPVDEHRRPRPDWPLGPRWDNQHVELLVIALPHLVAMAGLPAHIQAMRADPGLAGSCRGALRWPQLPQERPLQCPQRRQLPTCQGQFTVDRGDVPIPPDIRLAQLVINPRRRAPPIREADRHPAPHRP